MAKIIVFVPDSEMLTHAEDIILEKQLDAKAIFTDTQYVLSILRRERERGALVAVARGNHALRIKEETDMPLSEITITGQELAILLYEAKKHCDAPGDLIALIGFYNMFSDVQPIAKALDVNVKVYYAPSRKAMDDTVAKAQADGAKLVIGGETAIRHAQARRMETMFLKPTKDSIEAAVVAAKRICYGIEVEQKKTSEFMSLMDYSFDAIIKLDQDGIIRIVNANAEQAFHTTAAKMVGRYIFDVIKAGEESLIKQAVLGRRELHSTIVKAGNDEYIANLALIGDEEHFEGFILSMQSFFQLGAKGEGDSFFAGQQRASRRMEEYQYPSEVMKQLREDAEHVAQYDLPVLITGAYGTDMARLAQCLHNASARAEKSFIRLNLADVPEEMHVKLFSVAGGSRPQKTVIEDALSGTVLLENIDLLGKEAQPYLAHILRHGWVLGSSMQPVFPVDCRLIMTTGTDLGALAAGRMYSRDLYYALSRITLRMPSLSERSEDMDWLINEWLAEYTARYGKTVRLRRNERKLLGEFAWQGDELELSRFIEKLVLFAEEADVDEKLLTRLRRYNGLDLGEIREPLRASFAGTEEGELIAMIEKYHGNREMIAAAMGVSKTTLWRKLKKYNLIRN